MKTGIRGRVKTGQWERVRTRVSITRTRHVLQIFIAIRRSWVDTGRAWTEDRIWQRGIQMLLGTPPATKVRAADSVLAHTAKAIELDDIEARLSALERGNQ
jgi:hypothetical protein